MPVAVYRCLFAEKTTFPWLFGRVIPKKVYLQKYTTMKAPKLIAVLFLFLSSGIALAQTSKNEKAVIKTAIYCDHCKACETCGKTFQGEMLKIKGVKMYELDEKNNTITVYYNGQKTDLKTIQAAITKLGYDADDMKADVAAYEKLDGCCKKE
jgi:periplasmic mercuric ion binding protein